MATIYLGLGSNLGDREQNIHAAIAAIKNNHIEVEKISSIIETDPEGGPPQGTYLNAVVKAQTALPPDELLSLLKDIEQQLGRKKRGLNAPREIDIDILLYDDLTVRKPNLTIPHPRMLERSFVTIPLAEIEPQLVKRLKDENI